MRQILQSGLRQAGSILLVVLVYLLVLGGMALSALEKAQLAQRLEYNFSDRGRAFHAAESALLVAEQMFFEAQPESVSPPDAAGWPPVTEQTIDCTLVNQPAMSSSVSSLSGFEMLAHAPVYRIQSDWAVQDQNLEDTNDEAVLAHCGELYQVQSCGYGRRIQTVVHLVVRVYACCDVPQGCANSEFYAHARSMRELR